MSLATHSAFFRRPFRVFCKNPLVVKFRFQFRNDVFVFSVIIATNITFGNCWRWKSKKTLIFCQMGYSVYVDILFPQNGKAIFKQFPLDMGVNVIWCMSFMFVISISLYHNCLLWTLINKLLKSYTFHVFKTDFCSPLINFNAFYVATSWISRWLKVDDELCFGCVIWKSSDQNSRTFHGYKSGFRRAGLIGTPNLLPATQKIHLQIFNNSGRKYFFA